MKEWWQTKRACWAMRLIWIALLDVCPRSKLQEIADWAQGYASDVAFKKRNNQL